MSAVTESPEMADTLSSATIVADRGFAASRTDTLLLKEGIVIYDISDLVKRIPGFSLGDYGGPSGLKTLSLRGLGSTHTAIYVDDVRVGNVQSGQSDLGMIDIATLGSAVVDYARNSISFNTAKPVFSGDHIVAGNFSFRGGSFGTCLPAARLDVKASSTVSISASLSGAFIRGNFPYGDGLTRTGNDISRIRAGYDIFGSLESGSWHLKSYLHASDRGTPGSTQWPSEDRQKDKNALLQGSLSKSFGTVYTLHASAKVSFDDLCYDSTWGRSDYGQSEYQFNSSHLFRLTDFWSISLVADGRLDRLASTGYDASRVSVTGALGSAFRWDWFKANLALEYDGSSDIDGAKRHSFSPSADLRLALSDVIDLVAFGRRAYRVPTFNELYYPHFGNPDLKPEDAWLADVGFDYHRSMQSGWTLDAKLDGFYNYLTDKIISAPSEDDPYKWLPYNVGKVVAMGTDASASVRYSGRSLSAGLSASYSYQSAEDRTDGDSYGRQIAYVAKHSAVLSADALYRRLGLRLDWTLREGLYDSVGEMSGWNTLDMALSYSFSGKATVSISVKNLLDKSYEVVRYYPMPGRSIMGGLELKF